jgi:hypothetical protein
MTKYREGDEVTMRGHLTGGSSSSGSFHIELCVGGDPKAILPAHVWAFPDAFLTHTPKPRPFKVGDRVTWGIGEFGYELVFIGTNHVAINHWGEPRIVPKADLRPWLKD